MSERVGRKEEKEFGAEEATTRPLVLVVDGMVGGGTVGVEAEKVVPSSGEGGGGSEDGPEKVLAARDQGSSVCQGSSSCGADIEQSLMLSLS